MQTRKRLGHVCVCCGLILQNVQISTFQFQLCLTYSEQNNGKRLYSHQENIPNYWRQVAFNGITGRDRVSFREVGLFADRFRTKIYTHVTETVLTC